MKTISTEFFWSPIPTRVFAYPAIYRHMTNTGLVSHCHRVPTLVIIKESPRVKYRTSVRGAMFLGGRKRERLHNFNLLKKAYDLRSTAVHTGALKGKSYVGLPKIWAAVARRAGITPMTIHGMRHWFASAAAEMNFSELVIAGMLGHSFNSVTARYAVTPDSALIAAADQVSERLSGLLDIDVD
ncbi:MAG: tyrosine-type recombinase/integrase [Hyphomicrobiales bacterium]|nr:tyrosine-type recombinase/integrase [Hyphomicrobiales bacterium]